MQASQKPNGAKAEFLKYPASEVWMPPQGAPPLSSQGFPGLKSHQKPMEPPNQLPWPHLIGAGKIDILGMVIGTGLLLAVSSPAELGDQPSVGPGLGFAPRAVVSSLFGTRDWFCAR